MENIWSFHKYSGAGNDFLIFDNRSENFPLSSAVIQCLCARRTGVGADGVILIETSERADYAIRFFNADGSEAEMCGNGLRCAALFLHHSEPSENRWLLDTYERQHQAWLSDQDVTITMGEPTDLRWDLTVDTELGTFKCHYLNTGVPHIVLFVENCPAINLDQLGPVLRYHSLFAPKGANINVAERKLPNRLVVRTFERGVEGETLACGTGATAVALAASREFGFNSPVQIRVSSQATLNVSFKASDLEPFSQVTLTGPAEHLFTGKIDLSKQAIPTLSI